MRDNSNRPLLYLIHPDSYLNARHPPHTDPFVRLWTWVLIDGVARAVEGEKEEIIWLYFSDHYKDIVGSYQWICNNLGIDGDAIRERVRVELSGKTVKGARLSHYAISEEISHILKPNTRVRARDENSTDSNVWWC